jgi:hypothetical protein
MAEPERLCDFQAIFLVEIFSQYRARRCSRMLSTRFETMYLKVGQLTTLRNILLIGVDV